MKQNISYRENPDHYKQMIQKINEECNFPAYLMNLGYEPYKKSAGSYEFRKEGEKIVVMTSRSPVSYFNRNDSEDKGRFFSFLRNRSPNFYEAVKNGLEIINRAYEYDGEKPIRKAKQNKSLEENYHISDLKNAIYLTKERMISIETINSEFFKGRILNAFHYRDNQGRIANIAFPKFDQEGRIKNYILYNRPYRDRETGKIKKLKLVLNNKDWYPWYSNIPSGGIKRMVLGESGIDLLSFNELRGEKGDFYFSFGGNVYKEKLDEFIRNVTTLKAKYEFEIISAFDNDVSGYEFDLKVFSRLVNEFGNGVYFETKLKNSSVQLKIHYNQELRKKIAFDFQKLHETISLGNTIDTIVRETIFLDKIMYEFSIPTLMETMRSKTKRRNMLDNLLLALNTTYFPMQTDIIKSKGKDWNQDLKDSKKKVCMSKWAV